MPPLCDDTDAKTNPLGVRMAQLQDKLLRILTQVLMIRSESAKFRVADVVASLDLNLSKVWKPTIDPHVRAQLFDIIPDAGNKKAERRAVVSVWRPPQGDAEVQPH